eukprot:scaffold1135_cov343-Prasinococcus_capsulatus_cf.AAC.21
MTTAVNGCFLAGGWAHEALSRGPFGGARPIAAVVHHAGCNSRAAAIQKVPQLSLRRDGDATAR